MPRACTICIHPKRSAIDRALVHGVKLRQLAPQFACSPDALKRHAAAHLPSHLAKATEAAVVAAADDLLAEVRALKARALAILETAEAGVATIVGRGDTATVVDLPDLRAACAAIREARGCLELLGKLQGQLPEGGPTVVLLQAPEWLELRRAILTTLRPYPEARAAVVAALEAPVERAAAVAS